jgi:hypothetical protein
MLGTRCDVKQFRCDNVPLLVATKRTNFVEPPHTAQLTESLSAAAATPKTIHAQIRNEFQLGVIHTEAILERA